jgi:hypothetical protein
MLSTSILHPLIIGAALALLVPTPGTTADASRLGTTPAELEGDRLARAHRIVMGRTSSGALEVLCLGSDDLAYRYVQDAAGAWRALGALDPGRKPLRTLTTFTDQEGLQQVVVLGRDDGKAGILMRAPDGAWGMVEPLPSADAAPLAALTACVAPDGTRQVLAIGRKDGRPRLATLGATAGRWATGVAPATPPGLTFCELASGTAGVGGMPVVLIGRGSGQIYLTAQAKDGTWSDLRPLPNFQHTPFSAVNVAPGSDGYRQLVCIGREDGQPYLLWQDVVSGAWDFSGAMANPQRVRLSAVATGTGQDGVLQVLCLGRDDGQPHVLRHGRNGRWAPLASVTLLEAGVAPVPACSALAVGSGGDGVLQLVCLGRDDGQPYLFTQDGPDGAWMARGLLTSVASSVAPLRPTTPGEGKDLGF